MLCCQRGSACPVLLAAHRLVRTLDFVVVVILKDGDGGRVVTFHLQQGSLVAGSDVFHLKERRGHWLSGELGALSGISTLLGKCRCSLVGRESQWPHQRQVTLLG